MDERLGVWLSEALCSDMMQIRLVNKISPHRLSDEADITLEIQK